MQEEKNDKHRKKFYVCYCLRSWIDVLVFYSKIVLEYYAHNIQFLTPRCSICLPDTVVLKIFQQQRLT